MSAARARLAALLAGLALAAASCAHAPAQPPALLAAPGARDSAAAALPDSLHPMAHVSFDLGHTAADSALASAAAAAEADSVDSLAMRAKLDSLRSSFDAGGRPETKPGAKGGKAAPAEPPYHVAADKMTGGRGPEGDVLYLTGVTVTRSGTVLDADNGRYLRQTGMIYLDGRVKIRDSTTTATCDHATFSENDNRLQLDGNVTIHDHDATLAAPSGWFDRKTGEARLIGGVTGTEKKQRLFADEAIYERDSMIVRADGNVRGFDDEAKTDLAASHVDWFRRTRLAIARGEPVLTTRDDDGRSTQLRARLLRVNSGTRVAEAIDSVTVVRDTMQASGDYAAFDDSTGHGVLLGHPRAWDHETTVTGDTLETFSVKRQLERVVVRGNATMDYAGIRETNRGETSRLTGSRVDVFVKNDRIDSLLATGQAMNRYSAPPRDGKTAESNVASGDSILVFFKDRKIDLARVQGGAKGEYRPPVAVADTAAIRAELVQYDGRRIEFQVPKNKIVLDGAAHLVYRDLELHSRRVEFDSGKNTLIAEGDPQLIEKGDQVSGRLMSYDLESRTGTIYQATTEYERGLYHGEQIRKAGDNELDVLGGSYSTCDLAEPHYHFSAKWMKIYLKDKLVAKPVVFYLRNVPVLALPFYVFPIKPGRHSGFLFPSFEFGFNNSGGQFVRNAGYYWAPNDYFDLTAAGDYFQAQPSWNLHTEGNYKLLYAFDGGFQSTFTHDDFAKTDNYSFNGSHAQTFGDRTRLTAQGQFVSNRDYNLNPLNGNTQAQQLNRFLRSNVSLSHNADWISLSAFVDRYQDLNADLALQGQPIGTFAAPSLTTSEPSVAVSFPTRTLGSYSGLKDKAIGRALKSTYVTFSARFLSQNTERSYVAGYLPPIDSLSSATELFGRQSTTRRAFASDLSLTDSRRLFGWLNFAPTISANSVVFDFDETGRKVVPAAVWSSRLGLGSTFYKTVRTPFDGISFRHVFSPSIGFSYAPEFPGLTFPDSSGIERNRFNSFGGFGISGFKQSLMSYSIDQRLQVKRQHGTQVQRLDNLLSWTTSGSIDFLYREDGRVHPLTPLLTSLHLQPPGLLYGDASANIDPYAGRPLTHFGYNLGFNASSHGAGKGQSAPLATERRDVTVPEAEFRETWQVSLAYSYGGGYIGPAWSAQQNANATMRWSFSPNWVVDYSTALDLTQRQVLSQRFSLSRKIHCWDAIFTRSFAPGLQTEYYFRIGVRDQREIFYERGSKVQTLGGIQ